jgi:hypothetical protein
MLTHFDVGFAGALNSTHSSYNSHASRLSYTSHHDLLGAKGRSGAAAGGIVLTKESQLMQRISDNKNFDGVSLHTSQSNQTFTFVNP